MSEGRQGWQGWVKMARHQTRCLVWEKGAVGKWAEGRKQIGNWWWGMRVGGGVGLRTY